MEEVLWRHEAALLRPATPKSFSRCCGFACVSAEHRSEKGDSLALALEATLQSVAKLARMESIPPSDPGRVIDWSRASEDYARHRQGYPEWLWEWLEDQGVGGAGQRVVDLGTGTGLVARPLAARGARVVGVDVAEGQVAWARRLSDEAGLDARFVVASAESTGLPAGWAQSVTAGQCWLYFRQPEAADEVKRMLAPGGRLATMHLCWLPREDAIARASESLVLEHNPAWAAADWDGGVPEVPAWSRAQGFRVVARTVLDVRVPFTREGWRGRFRACRGVGASLDPRAVADFDAALDALLEREFGDAFEVLHRVDAQVFEAASV